MPRFIGILSILLLFASPVLAMDYSTFLGGGQRDAAYSLVIDELGNVLVTGLTRSADFPTTAGVYGAGFAGGDNDLFIIKLSPDLGTLLASTYIGGSSHEGTDFVFDPYFQMDNLGPDMALDSAGNVLLTGSTLSLDFPTTAGAYRTVHNTVFDDAFLLRMSADLSTLMQSTLFGGENRDIGRTILAEPNGAVVVGGDTRSTGFPVTSGAFDTGYNGGEWDVFLIRFTEDLSAVSASTFFGGDLNDYNRAILRNDSGAYYLTGWTISENLPSTPGAFDLDHNGGSRDVYVALFSADFSSLDACTYLGGHDWGEPYHGGEHEGGCDEANSLVFDLEGNLVVVGTTHSHDFPVTLGTFDPVFNNGIAQAFDGFVAVFNPDLTSLLHASYLGGRHIDEMYSVKLDAAGDLVIAGGSHSIDFPVTPDAMDGSYNGALEAVVVRVSADLSSLDYATYMGGGSYDQAYEVVLDSTGQTAVVAGYTFSPDFQLPGAGFDQSHNGDGDAFVIRTDMGNTGLETVAAALTASPATGTLPFNSIMCADVINVSGYFRGAGGTLNVSLPGGQYYPNFRSGYTTLSPGETYHLCWNQWFPDLPTLDGSTLFQLVVQDATPAPYNQPPYPASGSVATEACTVTAVRP